MLCTNCNAPVLPVVAWDIDGTLGRYHSHLLLFAQGYFGRPMRSQYDGSCKLHTWMGVSEDEYRRCKLAFRQGGMKRTMPAYEGAVAAVARVRDAGAEVWITTTRPYMRLDNVDPDTQEWLSRRGIGYDGLIYDEDKYARLLAIVGESRVVGAVEDLPEQYDRAQQLGLAPIQIARTHNSTARRSVVAYNLYGAADMMVDRVKGWRKANGIS